MHDCTVAPCLGKLVGRRPLGDEQDRCGVPVLIEKPPGRAGSTRCTFRMRPPRSCWPLARAWPAREACGRSAPNIRHHGFPDLVRAVAKETAIQPSTPPRIRMRAAWPRGLADMVAPEKQVYISVAAVSRNFSTISRAKFAARCCKTHIPHAFRSSLAFANEQATVCPAKRCLCPLGQCGGPPGRPADRVTEPRVSGSAQSAEAAASARASLR